MPAKRYTTKEAVLRRGKEARGIPLGEIDKTGRIATGKGAVGHVLEESWFGYSINSDSEPDFPEAEVELKATPYHFTQKGERRAKERLVCNIINYEEEYTRTFETSSFWTKCRTMLIMSYEHQKDIPKAEWVIDEAILFSFPPEDLAIIRQDWETIMGKVRAGKAHEISEGDTLYLGACTKGASAKTLRRQPCSGEMAKQRAYSLKQSYMTYVINTYVYGDAEVQSVVKQPGALAVTRFEDYIEEKVRPYFGRTEAAMAEEFGVNPRAKHLNDRLLAKILGIEGRISETQEFQKAGIAPKSIRVRRDGYIKESMSFPPRFFYELLEENFDSDWEESGFYEYLSQTKFLFSIFRENSQGDYVFSEIIFWHIPQDDLDEAGRVWQRTVTTLHQGVELKQKGRFTSNNLPKASESRVAHVRPHGRDKGDAMRLPDGQTLTKQSFWLNNSYIRSQVERHRNR